MSSQRPRATRAALTLLVALAACTSNEPIPDPTTQPPTQTRSVSPTPSDTPAPTESDTIDPEAAARAEVQAVFDAYVQGFTSAMTAGPTPPLLVEHLDGIATGSWIIELQNGFGPTPPPVENPPTYGVLTITDVDLEAGVASGTTCYGPVTVGDNTRRVTTQIEIVRDNDGRWLVVSDRADGESTCDA